MKMRKDRDQVVIDVEDIIFTIMQSHLSIEEMEQVMIRLRESIEWLKQRVLR